MPFCLLNRHYEKIGGQIIDISEDIPFDIPDSWQWTRLGHIANMFTGNSISDTEKRTKYTHVNGMEYIGTKMSDLITELIIAMEYPYRAIISLSLRLRLKIQS